METKNVFAERICALRRERKLTQAQIAEMIGISKTSANQYENMTRVPDIQILAKYAQVLGVTSDYLLGISDNRTNETAAIGDKLGLSDEAIASLTEYAEKSKSPQKAAGMSLSVLSEWEIYKYTYALEVLNRILPKLSLLNTFGNYLFDKQNDYTAAHEIVYETGDIGILSMGQEFREEQKEINQAINMYRIQKELMILQKEIEQEETNAKENKRQE